MTPAGAEPISVAGLAGLRQAVAPDGDERGFEDGRVVNLVVARESDEFDMQLLDGMVQQTLSKYRVPGRDELQALGIAPVRDPAGHGAWVIAENRTRAVLFERHGTWCLYSQGSAARADANGDNPFCDILLRVFAELRPVNVYLATFSRLIRNVDFASRILSAARKDVGQIHCPEFTLEPANPNHVLLFSFFSGFADMERRAQATRLMLGLIAKHNRGEWWRGPAAVPLGYRLDGRAVVPDPRARHVVARMLGMLADGATAVQIAEDLGRLGVAAPAQTGAGWAYAPEDGGTWGDDDADLRAAVASADGATLAGLRFPKGQVARFYRHLPAYATGVLRTPHEAPVTAGVKKFGGHDVFEVQGKDGPRWYVDLTYQVGLPDGGWAPPAVLAAAAARAEEIAARSRGPLASPLLLPLLARPARWTDGGRLRQVSHGRGHSNAYTLISIGEAEAADIGPSRPGRPFDGWNRAGVWQGRVDGRADAHDLHASIAQEAAAAFEHGIDARVLPPQQDWPASPDGLARLPSGDPARRVEALRAAADAADAVADRSAGRYSRYTGTDAAHEDRLRTAAEAASADAAAARARLADAHDQAAGAAPPPLPRTVDAPAQLLLETLAALGRTAGAVPRDAAAAAGRVVRNLRMDADPVWIRWSAELHVPAADGILVLGPISGRVRNRHAGEHLPPGLRGRNKQAGSRDDKEAALLDAVLSDDRPVDALADRPGGHGKVKRQRLAARLVAEHGMSSRAAFALLQCPVPATRRAVWALAQGKPPAGVAPGFADLLRRTYLDGAVPAQTRWWVQCADRTPVVELFRAHGGSVPACQARRLLREAGLSDGTVLDLTTRSGTRPFLVRRPATQADTGLCCGRSTCSRERLALHRCPGCGDYATLTARVPECPVGILCAQCLRMPVPGSPQFPAEYGLLSNAYVEAKHADVSPDIPLYREKYRARAVRRRTGAPPPPRPRRPQAERRAARDWAEANGIRLKANMPVPEWAFERWEREARAAAADPSAPPVPGQRTPAAVRAWARSAGLDVPPRGRLSAAVWAAYDTACSVGSGAARTGL